MDLSRWKSGWPIAALSLVAVALITFFFALHDSATDVADRSAAPQLVAAQELTRHVEVEVSAPQRDAATGGHYVHATVTNPGDKPLTGPIVMVANGDGSLADPDGTFDSGKDYVTVVPEGKTLGPRQRIRSRRIGLRSRSGQRPTAANLGVWKALALSTSGGPAGGGGGGIGGGSSNGIASVPGRIGPGRPGGGAMQPIPQQPVGQFPMPDQRVVDRVTRVQNAWTERLFAVRGVHGTGTGLTPDGDVVVRVHVADQNAANNLPQRIDGVRVEVAIGPMDQAYFQPPPQNKVGQGGIPTPRPNPDCTDNSQARFVRPIPIGSSGTVITDPSNVLAACSTGTLGARVRGADGRVFILSNNHVIADVNNAKIGDIIVHPGPLDTACQFDERDVIGRLTDFEPIRPLTFAVGPPFRNRFVFDEVNVIDAAIAEVTADVFGNSTPCSGFGVPNSSAVAPVLGMKVEKFGRTTAFQTGRIIEVNTTGIVNYGAFLAAFVGQISIIDTEPLISDFGGPGDSGSLIVTAHPNLNPVGLLFAGGPRTVPGIGVVSRVLANPIGPVLERFNVTIDGAPSNFGPAGR